MDIIIIKQVEKQTILGSWRRIEPSPAIELCMFQKSASYAGKSPRESFHGAYN